MWGYPGFGGFGAIHGYLVFPPGGVSERAGTVPPRGFSGRFVYTTSWVPPVMGGIWAAWWHPMPYWDPRCVFTGTLRLGPVPRYREGGRVFGGFRPA